MPEEPCQCPDCQRFYREHDRLIRESPTLRQQQELSWAALQAFRTLSGRVLEDLQKQHGPRPAETQAHATPVGATEEPVDALQQAMADLENINAHLFSIEALMERIVSLLNEYPCIANFRIRDLIMSVDILDNPLSALSVDKG